MAGGCPALKQGNLTFGRTFPRPSPRTVCVLVFVFLALLPVGWCSSPRLLAYRPRDVELATSNEVFVFSKFVGSMIYGFSVHVCASVKDSLLYACTRRVVDRCQLTLGTR